MSKFRVTYKTRVGSCKTTVMISEINDYPDLETALEQAEDWAERQRWILCGVEELEEGGL